MKKILFLMVSCIGGSFVKSYSMDMVSYVYVAQKQSDKTLKSLQEEADKCLLAFQTAATEEKTNKHKIWVEAKDKLWSAQLEAATKMYNQNNQEILNIMTKS